MLHRFLASKKLRLILLLLAVMGFLIAAIAAIWSIKATVTFSAVAFSFLGVALIGREYSVSRLQDSIRELDSSISSIKYHTQPVHNIAGSVGRLREDNDRIESILGSIQVAGSSGVGVPGSGSNAKEVTRSYFAPSRIASISTPVLDGSVAGRIAAMMESAESSSLNLSQVATGSFSFFRSCAVVGPSSLKHSLEGMCDVRMISPSMASRPSDDPESYLIIDERSNLSGPWSGVLTTQGTDLFQELYKVIEAFRKQGTFIIVLPSGKMHHFTSTLRDTAHHVVGDDDLAEKFGSDFSIPVLGVLDSIAKDVKK